MKFKLDENLPVELVYNIRSAGHEAETVVDEGLAGSSDEIVLEVAKEESLVFLTLDKGIGDIRNYPPEQYPGIVLFRPTTTGRGATLNFVRAHLDSLLEMDLSGRLVVVTERGVRIR